MKAEGRRRAGRSGKPPSAAPAKRSWPRRFVRNALLWALPVGLAWWLLTPYYNLFLTEAAENLVRLGERPAVTRLQLRETHYFVIDRLDFPTARGHLYSVRITDVHFPLIMLGAFFLALPGVSFKRRLETLGWAVLLSIFFHILSLFAWVKFAYATQLGAWSSEHYGLLAQNFWGLLKHLLDLPFKFAMPLLLLAAFHLRTLTGRER